PVSVAVSVTVTAPVLQPAGALSVVTGEVVSIRTVAVLFASRLPAASVERYVIVWTPSVAGTVTVVPVVKLPAPSSLYSVVVTPEVASVAVRGTVTAVLVQAEGRAGRETGRVGSMRTVAGVCGAGGT